MNCRETAAAVAVAVAGRGEVGGVPRRGPLMSRSRHPAIMDRSAHVHCGFHSHRAGPPARPAQHHLATVSSEMRMDAFAETEPFRLRIRESLRWPRSISGSRIGSHCRDGAVVVGVCR